MLFEFRLPCVGFFHSLSEPSSHDFSTRDTEHKSLCMMTRWFESSMKFGKSSKLFFLIHERPRIGNDIDFECMSRRHKQATDDCRELHKSISFNYPPHSRSQLSIDVRLWCCEIENRCSRNPIPSGVVATPTDTFTLRLVLKRKSC